MMACMNGNKDIVQLLLSYPNIDLNTTSNNGRTAFMYACINGNKDVVHLLLDHSGRIELNARDRYGSTVIYRFNDCRYNAKYRFSELLEIRQL